MFFIRVLMQVTPLTPRRFIIRSRMNDHVSLHYHAFMQGERSMLFGILLLIFIYLKGFIRDSLLPVYFVEQPLAHTWIRSFSLYWVFSQMWWQWIFYYLYLSRMFFITWNTLYNSSGYCWYDPFVLSDFLGSYFKCCHVINTGLYCKPKSPWLCCAWLNSFKSIEIFHHSTITSSQLYWKRKEKKERKK